MFVEAKIMKIVSSEHGIAKHLSEWGKEVTYISDYLTVGHKAVLSKNNESGAIITSSVISFTEGENNVVITTKNSVYYLKKFIEEEREEI
jgi:hypothetical protein